MKVPNESVKSPPISLTPPLHYSPHACEASSLGQTHPTEGTQSFYRSQILHCRPRKRNLPSSRCLAWGCTQRLWRRHTWATTRLEAQRIQVTRVWRLTLLVTFLWLPLRKVLFGIFSFSYFFIPNAWRFLVTREGVEFSNFCVSSFFSHFVGHCSFPQLIIGFLLLLSKRKKCL